MGYVQQHTQEMKIQADCFTVPAVYHENIRAELIHEASLQGSYGEEFPFIL